MIDVKNAKARRQFFLRRALRKRPVGTGSDLDFLMHLSRSEPLINPEDVFGNLAVLLIRGVASRAFMPERQTTDIDILVESEQFAEAKKRLATVGFAYRRDLVFPNASLGLYGDAWTSGPDEVDLMTSEQTPRVCASSRSPTSY